jgi:hypothetical protein
MGITPPPSKDEIAALLGKHIVPFVCKDDKRVRPVLSVQVIPLVLPSDQAFMKAGEKTGPPTLTIIWLETRVFT